MSKGSGFLLIPAARLTAPEIRNLTAAQQTLYDRLHFALHQKNGCRQGYYSYSDLADLCNLHPSTVIEGIKVLVANNLLLKRNRVDARSIAISAGGRPFLAANGYRLLTPPSLCSDEEKAEIERLRLEWGQAEQVECRAWRRVRERHAPQASAEASAEAHAQVQKAAPISAPETSLAHQLVMDFHAAIGSTSPAGRREVALAEKMIDQHGEENVRMAAQYVIRTAQPRSFMLMDYYWHKISSDAPSHPVEDEATAGLAAQIREMLPGLSARVSAIDVSSDNGAGGMLRLRLGQDIEVGHDALAGRVSLDIGLRTLESVSVELDRMDELRRISP